MLIHCPVSQSVLCPTAHCQWSFTLWARLDSSGSRLSDVPGHKARWLLALLKPTHLEPSMKWWWKFTTGSHPVCGQPLYIPGWVFSMHKRLGVTHHVSTFCLCFVRVVQQCCFLSNLIKPVSFVACFSWLAHLQVRIPHCGYLSEGLTHIHTLPQGEPGSEPYICVTFTCELRTTCDIYCRLWIHCWSLALMEWSSRCISSVCGVLFLCWCHSTGDSAEVLTGLHTDYCIPPGRLHYL